MCKIFAKSIRLFCRRCVSDRQTDKQTNKQTDKLNTPHYYVTVRIYYETTAAARVYSDDHSEHSTLDNSSWKRYISSCIELTSRRSGPTTSLARMAGVGLLDDTRPC